MKIAGILGGMGPIATMDLSNKIIKYTNAEKDSEHVHILMDNNTDIPDRSAYILGRGENPEKYIIESALKLEAMGASFIVMPCNTAHYFYKNVKKEVKIPFINMIEEIANELKGEKRVGLLATKGTYYGKVYEEVFNKYKINVEVPPANLQEIVMELIYKVKKGNKGLNEVPINSVIEYFHKLKINKIILGCTELPVAFNEIGIEGDFLDPTKVLAISTIKLAEKKVVKL